MRILIGFDLDRMSDKLQLVGWLGMSAGDCGLVLCVSVVD